MAAVHADAVYDDGVLAITLAGSPPVIAIAGDIDECTYAGLMTTLDKFASGEGEVRISLAAVRHCDLAGLRAIVRLDRHRQWRLGQRRPAGRAAGGPAESDRHFGDHWLGYHSRSRPRLSPRGIPGLP
jgi:ABC-type transporter Mla MlaB component